jgi:protein translocase SecG subunit
MLTLLTVLQVLACIILVTSVLLQPSKGDGAFSPAANTSVGNSGGTNFLFKTTMACAVFLALSSLYMTWSKIKDSKSSVIDSLTLPVTPQSAPPAAPAAGESPVSTPPASETAPQ